MFRFGAAFAYAAPHLLRQEGGWGAGALLGDKG